MLGIREPDIYGKEDYEALVDIIEETCEEEDIDVDIFQSNHEGEIIDSIQEAYDDEVDGIVINPAGYTHTSIAIMDALKAVAIPAVEVHISDVRNREDFRQISYAGKACIKTISGMGIKGYREAILFLKNYLDQQI
jgi:3-dehydroquinate dehydratase-2